MNPRAWQWWSRMPGYLAGSCLVALLSGPWAVASAAPLLISPASSTVNPGASVQFTAAGGAGAPFAWGMLTNASGGSIGGSSGLYRAGPALGTDTVVVYDAASGTATATILVVPGPIVILPAAPTTPPGGIIALSASGGSGTGFVWSIPVNRSGASIATNGQYTAGRTGAVSDTVTVTDSLGASASVAVAVGAAISIAPAAPTTNPNGVIPFTASGGSGTGFAWGITQNRTGATIGGATGVYTAGPTIGTDTVEVIDSLGNVSTVNVTVQPMPLAITPASAGVVQGGSLTFTPSGGSGLGYAWSIAVNQSGASIGAANGQYVAGRTGSVVDTVQLMDSQGRIATASVAVGPPLSISPSSPRVAPGGTLQFHASGGSGAGYAWGVFTNASGGSIGGTSGLYTAGPTSGWDTIQVLDSLGNSGRVLVGVGNVVDVSTTSGETPLPFWALGALAAGLGTLLSRRAR